MKKTNASLETVALEKDWTILSFVKKIEHKKQFINIFLIFQYNNKYPFFAFGCCIQMNEFELQVIWMLQW